MTDVIYNGQLLSVEVPEAIVQEVERQLVGSRRSVNVEIPGRDGSYVFAEEPGDRRIELALDLQGADFAGRRAAVTAIANWADILERARLIVDDEPDRFYEAVLDDAPNPREWLLASDFRLVFNANPYALSLLVQTDLGNGAASPIVVPVNNVGDVGAYPVIQIDPKGTGYLENLTVATNGIELLTIANTFAVGQVVTVNSIASVVTTGPNTDVELTGAFDPNAVNLAGVSGQFPFLLPGANTVTVTFGGTATDVDVVVQHRSRYR